MSTERNTDANDEGELYIRDLASTPDEKGGDEEEDGIVTTMMVGEEGDRTGGDRPEDPDEGIVTTLALGEEGDRTGER